MVALEQENKELVEWFLDNDCDVNAVDVENRTALFFVKDKDIAQKLIEKVGKDSIVYDTVTFESGEKSIDEINRTLGITDLYVV